MLILYEYFIISNAINYVLRITNKYPIKSVLITFQGTNNVNYFHKGHKAKTDDLIWVKLIFV